MDKDKLDEVISDKITLRSTEDIKEGDIVGFDCYKRICPTNSPFKVTAIKNVKKGEISQFQLRR